MGLGTLLVRADASPEIGTGHVMRCLALAQAWQDEGGEVVYAVANCMSAMQQRLRSEKCRLVSVAGRPGSAEDATFTRELATELGAHCVVLDSYNFDSEYQLRLRKNSWTLLCLDDDGRCENYCADIVLNQNITANRGWYRNCPPDAQLLLGTSFCMLRREFGRWRSFRREIRDKASNILVTLGGNPPAHSVSDIVEALSAIEFDSLNVVIAVGASAHDDDKRRAAFPGKLVVRKNVLDMAALMKEADVAISAAGSTCWELCLLGLPTVLLDLASNQTPIALELERRNCALYAGSGEKLDIAKLAATVKALSCSPELRKALSLGCRELVDGMGAQRVLSAVQGETRMPEDAGRAVLQ